MGRCSIRHRGVPGAFTLFLSGWRLVEVSFDLAAVRLTLLQLDRASAIPAACGPWAAVPHPGGPLIVHLFCISSFCHL